MRGYTAKSTKLSQSLLLIAATLLFATAVSAATLTGDVPTVMANDEPLPGDAQPLALWPIACNNLRTFQKWHSVMIDDNDTYRRKADQMLELRLNSIEGELKLMREAMEQIARFDERMTALMEAQARNERRVEDHEQRMRVLESVGLKNSSTLAFGERLFWLLLAAIIAIWDKI